MFTGGGTKLENPDETRPDERKTCGNSIHTESRAQDQSIDSGAVRPPCCRSTKLIKN